jgi:hypothetical protein
MFWAVEKDGKTTYFLGTIHMGVDVDARLPAMVWDKLDAATTFAMETDTSDPKLASDMSVSVDTSLHAALGDAHWAKLEAAVGPAVAATLDHKKPMIAATLLAMRGLPSTPFMDGVLLAHATTAHKQVVFLEPAAAEMAVLEKWMDARAIGDLLDELDTADKNTKEMLAAYVAGDEARMLALSDGERAIFKKHGRTDREYDESMNDLLFRRNASWIPALEKLHAAGGGFVAVGAMHVIGKRSVLDLLGSKGYKVTRLTPPTP